MDVKVVVALVAGGASILVAVVSAIVAVINARRTEKLQKVILAQTQQFQESSQRVANALETQKLRLSKELEEQRAIRDARRDYEYEAKKRLYEQCEPLIFQASELATSARRRIASLARSAKGGKIRPDGSGWLSDDNYFFRSTVYMLLAPTTSAKILQRRLTSVDLSLEPQLQIQYELLKYVYLSWTTDFDLAGREPTLSYDPDVADPGEPDRERLLLEDPAVYRRQGVYFGMLEVISESLLSADSTRCKSFGEFIKAWEDPSSSLHGNIDDFLDLFQGFHPATHPVLWRVLALQYLHHSLFLALEQEGEWEKGRASNLAASISVDIETFDWRSRPDEAPEQTVHESFTSAKAHLLQTVKAEEGRLPGHPKLTMPRTSG